jgi:Domain of unknown function (DUF4136)
MTQIGRRTPGSGRMPRHWGGRGATLVLLVLASGCASTWDVDTFEAPEANFAVRHSFAWKEGELGTPLAKRPEGANSLESSIRAAVTEELRRKGYVEVPSASGADMIVSYQVAGSRKFVNVDNRRVGAPSPNEVLMPSNIPPPPASELPREQLIREGNIVVFAEDPSSGRLIWRGLVSVESRTESKQGAIRQTTDIARHITQKFPAYGGAH